MRLLPRPYMPAPNLGGWPSTAGESYSLENTVPRLLVDPACAVSCSAELGVVKHDEDIVGGDVDVCS